MFSTQYEEHLAHSAPCTSRWDGFDRGDLGRDDVWEYDADEDETNLSRSPIVGCEPEHDAHYVSYREAKGLDDIPF